MIFANMIRIMSNIKNIKFSGSSVKKRILRNLNSYFYIIQNYISYSIFNSHDSARVKCLIYLKILSILLPRHARGWSICWKDWFNSHYDRENGPFYFITDFSQLESISIVQLLRWEIVLNFPFLSLSYPPPCESGCTIEIDLNSA